MTHQEELCSRVTEMLSAKYLKSNLPVQHLDDGTIVITTDFFLRTNGNQELTVKMFYACKDYGIQFHCILHTHAPQNTFPEVADFISKVNSSLGSGSISCLTFDYRDGEIASRNFLQCISYVPTASAIYTITFDAFSLFFNHGDQLLNIMQTPPQAPSRSTPQLTMEETLQAALNGNQEVRKLVYELIGRDPDSPYLPLLIDAANRGNAAAIELLLQHFLDPRILEHFNQARPPMMPLDQLIQKTHSTVFSYLQQHPELPEHAFYMEQLQELSQLNSGNFRIAESMSEYYFLNEKIPALIDPQMAFQWYSWASQLITDNNWHMYQGQFGDKNGVIFLFYEKMAETLIVFGSPLQQHRCLEIILAYHERFKMGTGGKYISEDHRYRQLINILLGKPGYVAFRNSPCNLSAVANRAWAVRLYQEAIDYLTKAGDAELARSYASEFEPQLGIQYFREPVSQPSYSSSQQSTSHSSGGCYIATCVYGSYDCPQVWTLRRYRDEVLAHTAWGRAFIHVYYATSPTIVRVFGKLSIVRSIWKKPLDAWVQRLNKKGYSDLPYSD